MESGVGVGGNARSTTPIQSLEECENTSRDYERPRETNRLIRRELEQRKKERREGKKKKKVVEGISIRSSWCPLSHPCSGCDSHATAIHSLAVSARPCPFARDVCRETAPMLGQLCQTSSDIFSVYRVACPLPIEARLVQSFDEAFSCGAATFALSQMAGCFLRVRI